MKQSEGGSLPNMQDQDPINRLRTLYPELPVWTASDEGFEALAEGYLHSQRSKPLAIVRPRDEDEVAAVVRHATSSSLPLAVRSGGHDHQGRSLAAGALVLDVRDFREVKIVDDYQAAWIGGGISNLELAETLDKTGHATAIGACGTVGYAGWAMHGGYGPFSGVFGLGVDQILGARLVNCNGEIIDADEELLYGIRGAGSAFGAVVSLKIKIYKLEKVSYISLRRVSN
jgi:FAD/FMN-containing dehydrogenase